MSTPEVAFGNTETNTPLSLETGLFNSDAQVAEILKSAKGEANTRKHFEKQNTIALLYKELAEKDDPWVMDEDENGYQVLTVSKVDSEGEVYYLKIAVEGVKVDAKGVPITDGKSITVNGTNYNTIGVVTHTVGYSNYTFSKTTRELAISALGTLGMKYLWPKIWAGLKILAQAIVRGVRFLWNLVTGGLAAARQGALEAAAVGEAELAGAGVAVEGAGAGLVAGGITAGTIFIAVVIVIAVALLIYSFFLHNSYHELRVWNITRYNLDWTYKFDVTLNSWRGKMTSGPGDVGNDDTLVPTRIGAAGVKKIPGLKPKPYIQYADMSAVSSHEYNGLGYALQFFLRDRKTNELAHTLSVYYEIPWTGKNSHNLTFNKVDDLGTWFDDNTGNNQTCFAEAKTQDQKVVATSSYDYLSDTHPIPGPKAGSTNTAYIYQSVLCIQEPGLSVDDFQ